MSNKTFSRNGVTREFDEDVILAFSTKKYQFPEAEGWVEAPGEVTGEKNTDAEAAAKAAAQVKADAEAAAKADAEAAAKAEANQAPKSESEGYTTTDLEEIKKKLNGATKEDIISFFGNDPRVTMTRLRDELISEIPA
jgi:colicin import membrane protein